MEQGDVWDRARQKEVDIRERRQGTGGGEKGQQVAMKKGDREKW